MIRRIYILILLSLPSVLLAQQDPAYTQYIFDRTILNPAYCGVTPALRANVGYRQQFMGFEGAPTTAKLTLAGPIQSKTMGLGLIAVQDKVAAYSTSSFLAQYSYGVRIGKAHLTLGVQGGVAQHQFDFSTLRRKDAADVSLSYASESKMTPDASAGGLLSIGDFYVSYTAAHLIPTRLNVTETDRQWMSALSTHHSLYTGIKFDGSESLVIEPSALVKTVNGARMQIDFNANFIYKESISAGFTYRTGNHVAVLLRYLVKERLMIGYSYDYSMTLLGSYTSGSHEILLGYYHPLLPPARPKKADTRSYF